MFSVILFYVITIIGIFMLRRTRPDAPRPYRARGYPVMPCLYIMLASAFCIILLVSPATARDSGLGLVLVAVGVPVYFFFGKRFAARPESDKVKV